MKDLSDL